MGKLNQVIAVVSGKKSRAAAALTEAYHKIQKPPLFDGISRTYQPKDEDGEKLPSESKLIQTKCLDLIREVSGPLEELYNVVATQEYSNCDALASVVIDGLNILSAVPVSYLLFLEKQMNDLETFIGKLPTLDPAEHWHYDQNTDSYVTDVSESVRTKKVPKAFVKAEATKEHPAQVEAFTEDIAIGYWKTTKFSGALPAKEKNAMLGRVRKLKEAVVFAREQANSMEAVQTEVGKQVLSFVFGKE